MSYREFVANKLQSAENVAQSQMFGDYEGWADTSWMIKGGYVEDTE